VNTVKYHTARFVAVACLAVVGFVAPASAELIYGVAAVGNATNIVTWDSASPGALITGNFVTGLQNNETIVGLDYRPATGQLYALGTSSRLYTLNPATGAATAVAGAFVPPLNGFSFGFDFNPQLDLIRNVAETNMNRVLDPNTGMVQTLATNLFYGPADPNFGADPNVVHSAYTNNIPNAPNTQLYGIDTGLNILVTQANNAGTLGTVGPLGVDVGALGGFDISGTSGVAYATMLPAGSSVSEFYSINLATGAATALGVVDGGLIITAMSVAPVIPEPATLGMAAIALIGGISLRRRSA
jgi:hypothetical protein